MEKITKNTFYFIAIVMFCAILTSTNSLSHRNNYKKIEDVVTDTVYIHDTIHLGTLTNWQVMLMAMVLTESQFNDKAVGKNNDLGILQITPIYVNEVNRIAGTDYKHSEAFNVDKSLDMFALMQAYYNPEMNIDKGIYYHNKAGWYKQRVIQNIQTIKNAENVRAKIIMQQK